MNQITSKEEFVEKYLSLMDDNRYIFIDIKYNKMKKSETVIIPKENFYAKLDQITHMYDENMEMRNPDIERYSTRKIKSIIGVYGEYGFNLDLVGN